MPGLGWGFWIPDCRLEVFKYFDRFDFTLMIQKLFSSPNLGLVRWSPLCLAKLAGFSYSALCTLPAHSPTAILWFQCFGCFVGISWVPILTRALPHTQPPCPRGAPPNFL